MRDSSSAGSLKICRVHRNVIVLEIDLDVVAYAMKILVNVKGAGRELEPDRVLVLDAGLVISHVHVLNVKKKEQKVQRSFDMILSRLETMEQNMSGPRAGMCPTVILPSVSESELNSGQLDNMPSVNIVNQNIVPETPTTSITGNGGVKTVRPSAGTSAVSDNNAFLALAEAIKSLKPSHSQYYVSNFDPTLHDIKSWCEEVERARDLNAWGDRECLSRVASCLKGDAKSWLSEWVTSDRSWTNFKREFIPLCPNKLDYANILFDVMNNTSDKFSTFAEYARRSLLRLRVVKGLSEDLMIQIVIRGITDAQVRASAANGNLSVDNLVSFLSIYVKPGRNKPNSRLSISTRHNESNQLSKSKCFNCGRVGHRSNRCYKKLRQDKPDNAVLTTQKSTPATTTTTCGFCKKPGHHGSVCFAKERSETRNKRNINLCNDVGQSSSNCNR